VRLESALLCDFAEVRDSLLFVVAGGISRLWRSEFPGPMGVQLALIVAIEPAERNVPHELHVDVIDPAGTTIAEVRAELQLSGTVADADEVARVPVTMDFRNVTVAAQGWHTVRVRVDDQVHAELRVKAELRQPASPRAVPGAGFQAPPKKRGGRPN
jgi:hypothetical protein